MGKLLAHQKCETPRRYLGFNFNFSRHRVPHFHSQLDKSNSKLQGWKAKLLSQAGRMTLIKSVISSLHLNTFSWTLCNFWWGHENERRKLHMVCWDALCQSIWRGSWSLEKLRWLLRSCQLNKSGDQPISPNQSCLGH